jgi:DNA-directed RNA polymerase subunit RPC12/RpoP
MCSRHTRKPWQESLNLDEGEGWIDQEAAADGNQRRCPKCNFKLFPVGRVRAIRFHHLRHTTASLLLMSGADLAAVQRIMRH